MIRKVIIYSLLFFTFSIHADELTPKAATQFTKTINQSFLDKLPFNNKKDFEDAKKNFIGNVPNFEIKDSDGRIIWSMKNYAFLLSAPQVPSTVNPSLWRISKLNMNYGLYQVKDNIYQVRGYDLSNMSIIEGNKGIIIIDPLITRQTAKAGLELYYQYRPKKPVVAVIYTHSHADHYGGVSGITTPEDVANGKVKIVAPQGFLEAAVSENVYAGNAMSRRATYMYGPLLPKSEKGQVGCALGTTSSLGDVTLIPPTDTITKTGEKRIIDGVEMIFQMAPNAEAPAEMIIYFPKQRALCTADVAIPTMHNLYTLRGAQVRDAVAWWKTLNTAIEMFGIQTDVVFGQHAWPKWGSTNIVNFLSKQRDLYKYIHDQTLHMMNQGYTMTEIANSLKLPKSLSDEWYNRGYYGSVSHNAKAVFQRYLGWYDSNPAHLNQLPPVEVGKLYVEFMGGEDAVIHKAREYYSKGQYRWVAEVMNHVVFANPSNKTARELEADAFEQLGYQTENATWRNEYLMGAYELRHGVPHVQTTETASADTLRAMPLEMYLDYMGIRLNSQKAEGKKIRINLNLIDKKQSYALEMENSVLIYTQNKKFKDADATLNLTRNIFDELTLKQKNVMQAISEGDIKLEGNKQKLDEFMSLFDTFAPMFNIITPN
ncbi:MAG: alkyl sulfatase dimerization domain-containing protein, partial [Candidatus Rickettsiella isopodorum]|jgi:alkyl sulfatase BDS1-like metallo-beta-lactamase superfamily hydrolase|nr:alkyl sulfatase dimerization domain-containing protein [Candidatus Rickettsiella isopodorum]